MVTFLTILSWPIAGQAQGGLFRAVTKYRPSSIIVGGAIGSLVHHQHSLTNNTKRKTYLITTTTTPSQRVGPLVHSAVPTPSEVMEICQTKHSVTMPPKHSFKLDTIPDRTALYSTETQEQSRVDTYKESLTRESATVDPCCQSELDILKEKGIIEDR